MSRHRITITEIQPETTDAPASETKVFEQTFADLNLGKVIQQLNAQPRQKRKASANSEK